MTVIDAVDRYLAEHADVKCADPDRQHDIATHLRRFFGDTPIGEVDIPLSRAYARSRKAAPATVRRELGMLLAAANHAVRWRRMTASDMPRVEYPAVPKTSTRFYTVDEVDMLIRHAEGRLRAFIVLAYFSAARRKSIETLEVSQVDLRQKVIYLHKDGEVATAKRRSTVPILPPMERELTLLIALSDTDYVFGTPTDFYRQFSRLCRRLGIRDRCNPHLLRHSRATHLLQAGVDIFRVANLLGDTVATVERTYGHHTPQHAASAATPFDERLGA